MKVPGSDGNVKAPARAQDGRVSESPVHRKGVTEKASDGSVRGGVAQELHKPQVDTMNFSSLGALMRQELNPGRMADERRARIESLKEQIRNGSYAPSSEAVASSVSEEISLEVLLSGNALQDGDSR
jgi:anti-sigma28 factor (negative regulator of flagellin synthesis)